MYKQRRIPGMRMVPMPANGNAEVEVPPDLVWDENNPPFIHKCSQHTEHNPKCDGNCEGHFFDESEVKLGNEARAWARAGMNFHGVPFGLPFPGITVELFDLELKFELLQQIVLDHEMITWDE